MWKEKHFSLWISSISPCIFFSFYPPAFFFKLYHIFSFFLCLCFISLLHSVGMQLSRSSPRPRPVTETHVWTHAHALKQPSTSACFVFYINVLSCTSSSAAFIVVMLIHHSDGTWTGCWSNSRYFFVCSQRESVFFYFLKASTVVPVCLQRDLSTTCVVCACLNVCEHACVWIPTRFCVRACGWGFSAFEVAIVAMTFFWAELQWSPPPPLTSAFYSELDLFLLLQ